MTTEIIFNMNKTVAVTLTQHGAEILNKSRAATKEGLPEAAQEWFKSDYKAGEEYRAQLWSLMQDFGAHIYLGMSQVPFKDNIIKLEWK